MVAEEMDFLSVSADEGQPGGRAFNKSVLVRILSTRILPKPHIPGSGRGPGRDGVTAVP